jgi:CRISPR-associated protein Csm5
MKVPIKFSIETVSPIHIGCDEVYEPTGFVLDENKQQMIVFDPPFFISQIEDADKAKFAQICAKGTVASILEIYQFMRNKNVEGRMVDVCNDFVEHYRQTLTLPLDNDRNIQQNLNNFAIPRTAFCAVDQRPYIPGSAIKGALRTAYLNLMESEKKLSKRGKERNARNLEQRLMEYDGIPTDPFRMVKVSDFIPMGETRTRIVYGVNEKKKQTDRDARGLPLIFEVVPPGSGFVGTITVDAPLHGSGISKSVSIEKLLNSSTVFYRKEKRREDKELGNIGVVINSDYARYQDQNNTFLVRVGRHSGAESVTIEGHRNIKIMMGKGDKPKYLDHATTLWLASETRRPIDRDGLQPFGWVQLSRLTDDSLKEFQIEEQDWQLKQDRNRLLQQAESKRKAELKRQSDEEVKRQALEEVERRKKEEWRKAELEAMTPEEREIVEIRDPSVLESRVVEIFNRIDEFSEENKKALAITLKSYWETHGKWVQGSKKQRLKVKKIKGILGEL